MADACRRMVKDRFSSPEEVMKYRQGVESGLMPWERTVVDRYLAGPGRLLDIGCGGGREAIALCGMGYSVTGIDISASEIESARSMAAELGLDIDFRVCGGESLEFPPLSFDYVIIWAQALGNVPNYASRVELLRECRRVAKPAARLVFSVHNRDACEPIVREKRMEQHVAGVVLEDGDFILRGDSESDMPCYWHYFGKDEIVRLCDDAGWAVLECDLAKQFGQADWETVWVCIAESR